MEKRKNTIVAFFEGNPKPYHWYIPRCLSHVKIGDRVPVRNRDGVEMVRVVNKIRKEGSRKQNKHMVVVA